MATAIDLLNAILALAQLSNGKGFVVHVDLDTTGIRSEADLNSAINAAIDSRLEPIEKLLQRVRNSCVKTGVLFRHPQRGWAVKTNVNLTKYQEQLLKKALRQMQNLETFVRL